MNEAPQPQHKGQIILSVASIVLVLFVTAGLWQLNSRIQKLSDKVDAQHKTATEEKESADSSNADMVTLTSGKEGFTMTVPNGWGPLVKATDGDFFILSGTVQPTLTAAAKAEVIETDGYGSDGPFLFTIRLSDEGMDGTPQGGATEFTIGKGNEALVGKKYSYAYPQDDVAGIGHTRHQNDRVYQYVFTTKSGKKLDIAYNVYGSDPRNLVDIVDGIVRSIVVK